MDDRPSPRPQQASRVVTAIVVLGMHRSGTSALTRTLSLLGAALPGNLLPSKPSNETGFWESTDILEFNDRVLTAIGGAWHDWQIDGLESLDDAQRAVFVDEAAALLRTHFRGSEMFVLKDPRICLLLPLWQQAIADFGASVQCVLPLRDPREIAASLQKRDDLAPAHSHALWLRYVLDAEHYSRALPRSFVSYEQLLDDWRGETTRVAAELGLRYPRPTEAAAPDIDAFLRPDLRHQVAEERATVPNDEAPPAWVNSAYQSLFALSSTGDAPDENALLQLDALRARFTEARENIGMLADAAKQRQARLRQEVQAERKARDKLAAEKQALAEERGALADERDILADKRDALISERDALQEETAHLRAKLTAREEHTQAEQAKREQAEKRLREETEKRRNAEAEGTALVKAQRQRSLRTLQRQLRGQRLALEAERPVSAAIINRVRQRSGKPARPARPHAGAPPARTLLRAPMPASDRLRLPLLARQMLASGFFDTEWYALRYPDTAFARGAAVWHWLLHGQSEGRSPNALFEPHWYMERHEDVRNAGMSAVVHYLRFGAAERRAPGPLFQPHWYLERYPDVAEAGMDPLLHFLRHGIHEDRNPNSYFDAAWYRKQYPDVADSGLKPLHHYLLCGGDEGRDPSPRFKSDAYLRKYPEIRLAGLNPLHHFLSKGPGEAGTQRLHVPGGTATTAPDSDLAAALQVRDSDIARAQAKLRDARFGTFSIVIPTWNRRDTLPRAIDSILAQSYDNWELIVCDDGSTDGTDKLMRQRYADQIATGRIRYLQLPHGGVCAARNAGLAAARGEWIAYLDSDNAWHPHYLLLTAEAYSDDPESHTAYACLHVHDAAQPREFIRCRPFDRDALERGNYIDLNIFSHHRSVYEDKGGFDETLRRLVDWDLILRYTETRAPLFIPYTLCDYHIAPELANITLTESLASNESAIRRKAAAASHAQPAAPPASAPAPSRSVSAPAASKTTEAAPSDFEDFDSYLRRAAFVPAPSAPFSEPAKRVMGHMRAVHRHLSAQHPAGSSTATVSIVVTDDARDPARLRATLAGISGQSHLHIEPIIVSDGPASAAASAAALGVTAQCLPAEGQSLAAKRNLGLVAANGDYLCFLEGGDRLDPDFLRLLLGTFTEQPARRMAYCAQAVSALDAGASSDWHELRYVPFMRALFENRPTIDLAAVLFRRDALLDECRFDESLPALSGWDFLLRLTEGEAPVAVPCVLCETDRAAEDAASTRAMASAKQRIHDGLGSQRLVDALPQHARIRGLKAMHALAPASMVAARPEAEARRVNIIIPSYECLPYLKLCVDAVKQFSLARTQLTIVDNASSREVRRYLAELAATEQAVVIQNEENLGFTYAVNQGIAVTPEDADVVLLNNDAVVTPGWIEALQQVFADFPDAGLAVTRQVLLPGTKTMRTHNPMCDDKLETDVNLSRHHDNIIDPAPGGDSDYTELSFAPFFCVYIPRETLQSLGPLDHVSAPHYRSDRLYCEAVRRIAGRRIIYTHRAKLYHFLQQATGTLRKSDSDRFKAMFVQNEWSEVTTAYK